MGKSLGFLGISAQLVRVKTENNIDLPGFLSLGGSKTKKVFVMFHGRGGSFFSGHSSFLPCLVETAHKSGFDFLGVSDSGSGFFRIYDIFESCLSDYDPWIKFAKCLGYKKIVLGAHSYGPIKISYYYSQKRPKIDGLFYLAPTDTYGIWKNFVGENKDKFLALSAKMVKAGFGKKLMPDSAYYNPISAQSYLSLYGQNSKIHIFDFQDPDFDFDVLKNINIPVLIVLGGKDKNPRDAAPGQKAEILKKVLKKPTVEVIKGADHIFSGKNKELGLCLESWLNNF